MYIIDACHFVDGYIQGPAMKIVENIDTEHSCAVQVKKEYPEASGATWHLNNRMNIRCWAEFGEKRIHANSHRTCFFQREYFCLNI